MEIRTLSALERPRVARLLDDWPLSEGWTAGDRFRRQAEFDPRYSDRNVWIAVEQDEILGVLTIFPRMLRILGHPVPTGGIGNLFTAERARGRGIGTELLEHACDTMRGQGLELGLLFPSAPPATPPFFEKRGWYVWGGQRTILRRAADSSPRPEGASPSSESSETSDDIEISPVGPEDKRALQAVKSIHAAYGASRSGTVDRDDAMWQACLELRPAPIEEFWIARRGGLAVAYARAAIVDDVLTLTELGRFEDGADALAKLVLALMNPREQDVLARPGLTSAELRSFLVLPTFDDIGLIVALEHRGIRSHPMDAASGCLRCANLIGLAARLDVDLLPDEDGRSFLARILPPDAMVFWPSDRF
jgi:GNAT superfamily N-acetyltransferase